MMNKIRTLGFYQPFGSLMLHDKIETRFVRKGRKPPFPVGHYLIYTTQKRAAQHQMSDWCGGVEGPIWNQIISAIKNEDTLPLDGYAIAIAELTEVIPITKETENTFVKFVGEKIDKIDQLEYVTKVQWGLHFKNVQRIKPFKWKHGKQGIGVVPENELSNIIIL